MVLPTSGSLSYNTIRAEFGSPSSNVYLSFLLGLLDLLTHTLLPYFNTQYIEPELGQ